MEIIKVILTSVLSAAALFIIAKIMGHKQIAQLDVFGYITGITIGSIAAELATEPENVLNPLVAMIVYGAITVLLTTLTGKFQKTRKFINGTPTIIMSNDKIFRKNMKKAKIDLSEFMVMCRQEGYFDLSEIQTAIFEYNGRLTILPKSEKRPTNAEDLGLTVQRASISTEVIMDGRVLSENLIRLGLDETWLSREIKRQGGKKAQDIFLALCDNNNNLSIYYKE